MSSLPRCYDLDCKRKNACQYMANRPSAHSCHIAFAYRERNSRGLPQVKIVGPPLPPCPIHGSYHEKKQAFTLHHHKAWKAAAAYEAVRLWEIATLNPHISWRQVGVKIGLPDTPFIGSVIDFAVRQLCLRSHRIFPFRGEEP